ncbi:hypothetical protein EDD15DRAFT_2378221 [Pisolithus albus]|nr:hypothetical protein EDD15DRAFT_2378221 [Pisolithus albus]
MTNPGSSQPLPSFQKVCAMSPVQAGYVQGAAMASIALAISPDAAPATATARDLSLGLMMSLNEVLGLVPTDFREHLRPHFQRLAETAEKCGNVRATLDKLRRHKANGTLPPQLSGVHVPVFQFTQEYRSHVADPSAAIKAACDDFVWTALDKAITAKTAEMTYLDSLLDMSKFYPDLPKQMENEAKKLELANQVPVFRPGTTEIHHWELDGPFIAMRDQFLHDLALLAARVLAINHTKTVVRQTKADAKKKLKDVADVEMANATPKKRTEDLINKALSARLKQLGITGGSRSRVAKKPKKKES